MNENHVNSLTKEKIKNFTLLLFLISISTFRLNAPIAISCFILVFLSSIIFEKKIIITSILKWGILFWGYYIISILWSPNSSDTLRYVSAIVYAIGIYIFLPNIVKSEEDVVKTLKMIFYSIAFTSIFILAISPISSIGTERMGKIIGLNENTFGTRMAIGTLISLYLIKNKKKKKKIYKFGTVIFMIIFTVLTLLSGSKKALLLLILGLFFIEMLYTKGFKKIFRLILISIVILGVLLLVFKNAKLYSVIGYRIERTYLTITNNNSVNKTLNTDNGNMITTDRSYLEREFFIKEGLEMFKEKPVFGHGGNSFVSYMREINYSHVAYSHNNYVELLYTLGMFGFIIYYSFWIFVMINTIKIIRKCDNESSKRTGILFVIIQCLLLILDYGCVSYVMEFNMFLLCLFYIYIKIKEGRIIEND